MGAVRIMMKTTLKNIVTELGSLDDAATIYAAEPWTSESEAIVAHEPPAGGLPKEASESGLKYFIEVAMARDFLDGWIASLDQSPSAQEKCDRLIRYAVTDA
jgi:hypothetical protein